MIEIGYNVLKKSLPLAQLQDQVFFLTHIKQKPKGCIAKRTPTITSMSFEKR